MVVAAEEEPAAHPLAWSGSREFAAGNVIDHRAARITGGHLFFGVLRIQPPSNKMPS